MRLGGGRKGKSWRPRSEEFMSWRKVVVCGGYVGCCCADCSDCACYLFQGLREEREESVSACRMEAATGGGMDASATRTGEHKPQVRSCRSFPSVLLGS